MSHPELEPLAADLQALLDAERRPPAPPAGAKERLLQRLQITLALPPPAAAPEGVEPAGTGAAGSLGPGAGTSLGAGPSLGALLLRPLPLALSMFVLGAGAGAGLHAALTRPPARIVSASAPAPVPVASAPASLPASSPSRALPEGRLPPDAARPARPTASAAPHESGRGDTDLAAERAVLEMARTALTRGDSAAALATLERHRRGFPRAQLAEEREVLFVQALTAAGRGDEARARAARFHRRYPGSLFRAVIDQALKSIP